MSLRDRHFNPLKEASCVCLLSTCTSRQGGDKLEFGTQGGISQSCMHGKMLLLSPGLICSRQQNSADNKGIYGKKAQLAQAGKPELQFWQPGLRGLSLRQFVPESPNVSSWWHSGHGEAMPGDGDSDSTGWHCAHGAAQPDPPSQRPAELGSCSCQSHWCWQEWEFCLPRGSWLGMSREMNSFLMDPDT